MEAKPTGSRGQKSAKNAIKAKQLKALERCYEYLRLLVAMQRNAMERVQLSDAPAQIHRERLAVYDRIVPLLVSEFEGLGKEISAKHPGGAPENKFRTLAFDLLTECYLSNGSVLTAKELVMAVEAHLPKGALEADASGKEPFSSRIAGSVIRDFKACLHSSPNDWN